MPGAAALPLEGPEEESEEEADGPAAIEARVRAVERAVQKESRRQRCYAAAMGRAFDAPAHVFMPQGPREWPLQGRKFPYRSAAENGGVKTLTEMCLDVIDAAYETMGELAGPSKRWRESGLLVPTPVEHNKRLCVVPKSESPRVVIWSNSL